MTETIESISEDRQRDYQTLHDSVRAALEKERDPNLQMSVLLNLSVLLAKQHRWDWARFIGEVYGLWKHISALLGSAQGES